jgi:hypothetical protein
MTSNNLFYLVRNNGPDTLWDQQIIKSNSFFIIPAASSTDIKLPGNCSLITTKPVTKWRIVKMVRKMTNGG